MQLSKQLQAILSRENHKEISAVLEILQKSTISDIKQKLMTNFEISALTDTEFRDIKLKIKAISSLLTVINQNKDFEKELLDFSKKSKKDLKKGLCQLNYELYKTLFLHKHDPLYLVQATLFACISDNLPHLNTMIRNHIKNYKNITNQFTIENITQKTFIHILQLFNSIRTRKDLDDIESFAQELDKTMSFLQDSDEHFDIEKGFQIGGLANIVFLLSKVRQYLLTGESEENIYTTIDMYTFNAIRLLQASHESLSEVAEFMQMALTQLCRNSIWEVASKSPFIRRFFNKLLENDEGLIFSLMPTQRETIIDLLSSKKSIIVNMPTSAGKTLLAQVSMLYTIQNYRDPFEKYEPTICYVVPTNALINQIEQRLKEDFRDLNLKIETVLPFNEIDEIENEILSKNHIDILISTPEKLDFLIRQEHSSLKNLKQIILDEAHNLSDEKRGSKFELLLATIKLLRPDVNFLLLSPFIENAKNIATWLGGNEQDSITLGFQWSPSKQYVGCNLLSQDRTKSFIRYFPSAKNHLITEEVEIDLNVDPQQLQKEFGLNKLDTYVKTPIIVKRYIKIGGTVLVLAKGPTVAEKLANQTKLYLETELPDISTHTEIQKLMTMISLEMDETCLLNETLPYGIAYHHAQLPASIKGKIESLVSLGLIKALFATTTLAQGMNFPVTTVIFDTLKLGSGKECRDISSAEFWNIAGRAGRAYMESEGHIIIKMMSGLPQRTIDQTHRFIHTNFKDVISSLNAFFDSIGDDGFTIDYNLIKDSPAAQNFLQYLNHIIRVSYNYKLDSSDTAKIRNILSASLFYKEIEQKQSFLEAQDKIVKFARNYISNIKGEKEDRLQLADLLGITNISLNRVSGFIKGYQDEMQQCHGKDAKSYVHASSVILNLQSLENLTKIVYIINSIPEIKMDLSNEGKFDPELVAKIVMGWVNGESVKNIAKTVKSDHESFEKAFNKCQKYINSKIASFVPWGFSIYQHLTYDQASEDAKNLPSYIYYGVNDKESVILSRLGVPRFMLSKIRTLHRQQHAHIPLDLEHFDAIKDTLRAYQTNDFKDSYTTNSDTIYAIFQESIKKVT